LSLVGLIAILVSAFLLSGKTAFPGYVALLPTLGTVLAIVAGDVRFGPFRGCSSPSLVYIGDISYSLYLWHWPLLIFYTAYRGSLGYLDGAALIVFSILVAHLSYEYIEERYRYTRIHIEWKPFAYGLASIMVCVIAAGAVNVTTCGQARTNLAASAVDYPGPAALVSGVPTPDDVPLMPRLTSLKDDAPILYQGCVQNLKQS